MIKNIETNIFQEALYYLFVEQKIIVEQQIKNILEDIAPIILSHTENQTLTITTPTKQRSIYIKVGFIFAVCCLVWFCFYLKKNIFNKQKANILFNQKHNRSNIRQEENTLRSKEDDPILTEQKDLPIVIKQKGWGGLRRKKTFKEGMVQALSSILFSDPASRKTVKQIESKVNKLSQEEEDALGKQIERFIFLFNAFCPLSQGYYIFRESKFFFVDKQNINSSDCKRFYFQDEQKRKNNIISRPIIDEFSCRLTYIIVEKISDTIRGKDLSSIELIDIIKEFPKIDEIEFSYIIRQELGLFHIENQLTWKKQIDVVLCQINYNFYMFFFQVQRYKKITIKPNEQNSSKIKKHIDIFTKTTEGSLFARHSSFYYNKNKEFSCHYTEHEVNKINHNDLQVINNKKMHFLWLFAQFVEIKQMQRIKKHKFFEEDNRENIIPEETATLTIEMSIKEIGTHFKECYFQIKDLPDLYSEFLAIEDIPMFFSENRDIPYVFDSDRRTWVKDQTPQRFPSLGQIEDHQKYKKRPDWNYKKSNQCLLQSIPKETPGYKNEQYDQENKIDIHIEQPQGQQESIPKETPGYKNEQYDQENKIKQQPKSQIFTLYSYTLKFSVRILSFLE